MKIPRARLLADTQNEKSTRMYQSKVKPVKKYPNELARTFVKDGNRKDNVELIAIYHPRNRKKKKKLELKLGVGSVPIAH